MEPEVNLIAQYGPAFAYLIAAVLVIVFVRNYLFRGMVSDEIHREQVEREKDFVGATKEAAVHLEEIGRQLESLSKKVSEEIREMAERMRTLELVFSDNIDAIRELSSNCEKHHKNIPDTEVFLQQRRKS
jgi:hypothetical protein